MKESETIEFKESLTQLKESLKSISAMLNKHRKGKIIFGIKNNGQAMGVSIGKDTERNVSKSISDHIEPKIYPHIQEVSIDEKSCLEITFEGIDVPYFAYGRAYIRTADEDKVMSKLELERFILNNNKDNLNWDKQINTDIELKDISEEKLLAFTKSANLTFTNKQDVLKKLDLMKNNQLTNASILLFGKNPKDFFPLLNLRCASFTGVDKASNPIDMTDFQGDLFELIQKAETYVLEHINVGMKIEGLKRVNLPEINKDAFREAIINAFCHRDYSIPQEIQIAIFKDRVEILNPGKLYAGLSIKEILSKSISERRNPLIADIFHKVDFVEKWGTGIKRIRQLEPKTTFEEINRFFQVTFKRNPAPYEPKKNAVEKFTITKAQLRDKHIPKQVLLDWLGESWEKVGRSLGVNALKVLIVLYTKPEKTISELAVELDLSTTAIENNLKKLKDAKVLKRIGSDKEGYWEILPPNN